MGKRRKTFSLDKEVVEEFDRRDLNASGVANRLLREYLVGGETEQLARKLRLQDIERDIEAAQNEIERQRNRVERLRQQRQDIEAEIEEARDGRRVVVEEFRDRFGVTDPENPAVQNWADKADMDPYQFAEAVENGV